MTAWVELLADNRVEGRCDACRWHLTSIYVSGRRRVGLDRLVHALTMARAAQLHQEQYCEAGPGQLGWDL